ncbi:hypothetical protein OA50_05303 [Mameliella alba]|uniref:Uncharacterized protein n=1 Tax=Mameliella alba TaxID=561184 RepID=A0A0B3RTS8_9RHOB|nr:hypothetical protein OA50_05303 [Mameliella alba]
MKPVERPDALSATIPETSLRALYGALTASQAHPGVVPPVAFARDGFYTLFTTPAGDVWYPGP